MPIFPIKDSALIADVSFRWRECYRLSSCLYNENDQTGNSYGYGTIEKLAARYVFI